MFTFYFFIFWRDICSLCLVFFLGITFELELDYCCLKVCNSCFNASTGTDTYSSKGSIVAMPVPVNQRKQSDSKVVLWGYSRTKTTDVISHLTPISLVKSPFFPLRSITVFPDK